MYINHKVYLVLSSVLFLISCSSASPVPTSIKVPMGKNTLWYEVFHSSGVNVNRISMVSLKQSTQRKKNLANYYKVRGDFTTPEKLVALLKSSGRNAKLTKEKKLEWTWGGVKYLIPNIDFYRVQETREDTGTYDIAAYINQNGLDKIKTCLVMYSKNIGTLSSESCLKKYRLKR